MSQKTVHDQDNALLLETGNTKVAPPPRYQVLLLNDDYTPMDFVIVVLQQFFAIWILRRQLR